MGCDAGCQVSGGVLCVVFDIVVAMREVMLVALELAGNYHLCSICFVAACLVSNCVALEIPV